MASPASRSGRRVLATLTVLASLVLGAACAGTTAAPPPRLQGAGVTGTPLPAPATPVAEPPASQLASPIEADPELLRLADPWNALPSNYAPADLEALPASLVAPGYGGLELRREAAAGLVRLLEAARAAGHDLRVVSAFRSYGAQIAIFERRVAAVGEERAARGSARPGHSEHQLGTTVDLSSGELEWRLTQRLGGTPGGRWLGDHAHEHGWALSYPEGKEDVTGYMYEPWHVRYLGVPHATRWREGGLTVTEYLRSLE